MKRNIDLPVEYYTLLNLFNEQYFGISMFLIYNAYIQSIILHNNPNEKDRVIMIEEHIYKYLESDSNFVL